MQEKVKKNNNSLLRKTITVFFLPSLIIIWMIGWILVQTNSPRQIMKDNQKPEKNKMKLFIKQERDQEQQILA